MFIKNGFNDCFIAIYSNLSNIYARIQFYLDNLF